MVQFYCVSSRILRIKFKISMVVVVYGPSAGNNKDGVRFGLVADNVEKDENVGMDAGWRCRPINLYGS